MGMHQKTSGPLPKPARLLTRRTAILTATVLAAPGLILMSKTSYAASTVRPDEVDPQFWSIPRSVKLFNANTGGAAEALYWENGAYVMDAYLSLSSLLYDHHENKAVQLQPALFDLVWATQRWYAMAERRQTTTDISSGFRTPKTNALVGGAPGGLHPKAAALDGRMRGVPLPVYARMLQAFGSGGVGLYTKHVHWDVGRPPRFWHAVGRES